MWFEESTFYQIYPLGLCGAPHENNGMPAKRILTVLDWIPHLQSLDIDAVYFCPVFESDAHGYDTRDFATIDCRLGKNTDFVMVCNALHAAGIRVVLDGVFNHVGRGFWAFQDVLAQRENSQYRDWFMIDFNGNSGYNDNLWYEGWEGHYELVRLNLRNEAVIEYLFSCIQTWVNTFDIDGLRLDVAYSLEENFVHRLRQFTDTLKPEFVLIGEMLHGDYNRLVNETMLHSCTNYECYKGLHSSFNSMNMFEIAHSLQRQFSAEHSALYTEKHLFNFVDNHDVTRIATMLQNKKQLLPLYGLLFAMPGVPCIYYGSEWMIEGDKADGDNALRPALEKPERNAFTQLLENFISIRKQSAALCYGTYRTLLLTNKQFIFERATPSERVLLAINADGEAFTAHFDAGAQTAENLLTHTHHDFAGGSVLPPYSVAYWRIK